MNIYKLLRKGIENLKKEHAEKEKDKLGILRGGSVGCLVAADDNIENGYDIIGSCPREAYARCFLGWQDQIDEHTQIMFAMGHANEDIWVNWLSASGYEGKILREEDLGLEWEIDGVKGTGRPDIVMCDPAGQPKHGIELKMVASVWTARSVLLENKPKMNHLIQTGNYSYRMNDLPYGLWYTSYVNLSGPNFIQGIVPQRGEDGSQWIEYSIGKNYINRNGRNSFKKVHVYNEDWSQPNKIIEAKYKEVDAYQFKHIRPFFTGFDVQWNSSGNLQWRQVGATDWTVTCITKNGIDEYYRLVSSMGKRKQLPQKLVSINANNELENKFNPEDYSSLQSISDKAGDNFDDWMDLVKKRIEETSE